MYMSMYMYMYMYMSCICMYTYMYMYTNLVIPCLVYQVYIMLYHGYIHCPSQLQTRCEETSCWGSLNSWWFRARATTCLEPKLTPRGSRPSVRGCSGWRCRRSSENRLAKWKDLWCLPWYRFINGISWEIMVLSWYYHDIIMVLSWYHHGIIMVLSLYDHEKSTCSSMIIHDHTISHHGFDPWFYSYE